MDETNKTTLLSSVAYLNEHDKFIQTSGIKGQLVLGADDTMVFTATTGAQAIKINLSDVSEADFTNIMAKFQFIVTQKDGTAYIFGFAEPLTMKRYLKYTLIPFLSLKVPLEIGAAGREAQLWKNALVAKLPPAVVTQRIEVRFRNLVVGTLIVVGLVIVVLATIIFLVSR